MTRITKIEHPSHPGHLLKHEPPAEPFKCNACKELGFGSRYACEHQRCNYHLHEECASSEHKTSHPLFHGCEFTLFHESHNRVCDVCGVDIRGISYQCSYRKARDAHPCCLNLPESIITADGGVHLRLLDSVSSKCGRCGRKEAAKKVKGWFYSSNCGQYCFHVACVKEMILKKYKNGYFNKDKGYDP